MIPTLRNLSRLALGLAAVPFLAQAAMANLVTNGDFESTGGFSSSYALVANNNQANCHPPGVYTVGNNPNNCHESWASYGPHSGENQLIVNGAQNASLAVYISDSVTVVPTGLYHLSIFGASSYGTSPANLDIQINGVSLGQFQLSSTAGTWTEFAVDWTAVTSGAVISIYDLDTDFDGNDFTLDDISLTAVRVPTQPAPEPATLALLGAGLVGSGFRRRR